MAKKLSDVTEFIIDTKHNTPKYSDYGYPCIRTPNIGRGYFELNNVKYVNEETYEEWTERAVPKEGDLILAREAPVGNVAWIPPGLKVCIGQRTVLIRPIKDVVDPRYLNYYLLSDDCQNRMHSLSGGATVAHLNMSDIRAFEVYELPSLKVQKQIAAVLSAYDDLIENNLRRIKILEEMTQNLYREWFIKFRFPGHENTRFVDSPLGMIPEGWEIKQLGELIAGHIGGGWGKDESNGKYTEPAWVIRGTDIPNAKHCDVSKIPFRCHTESNLKTRKLKPRDIIFEVSGGSKGQPLGRALLISSELLRLFKGYPIICASFCKRIQPSYELYVPEMLYLSFIEGYGSGEIEQFQVQSTGISNFRWSDYLEKAYRCVPPRSIQDSFREITVSIFSQISMLGLKNHFLRQTRDLLLPKLISGEVDVSELDIKVPEEAVS